MKEQFLNPEKVLEKLNLKEGMVGADFGCGSGGWTIPLAKKIKKVFAIDILPEPLSALRGKAKMEKILNIDTIKCDVERGTTLISESCDLVLMTNLLFQVENIENIFQEAKRVLKKNGIVLVVDWKNNAPIGPEKRIEKEKIKEIAQNLGFELKEEFEAGSYHFGLIFLKL